jgi:hypothetical protein
MRRIIALFLVVLSVFGNSALGQNSKIPAAAVAVPVTIPSGPPPPNTLQDGTAVKLRLAENLTSATAKTGQQVLFEVVEEVDVEGVPVVAKGAQALATVTTAETKKSMGRGGKLDVISTACDCWTEIRPCCVRQKEARGAATSAR